jgi:hypothetical protein
MKDELGILISSSIYIKAFAIILMLAAIALVFSLSTGLVLWWKCFAVLIFLAQCALLFGKVEDRRDYDKIMNDEDLPEILQRWTD